MPLAVHKCRYTSLPWRVLLEPQHLELPDSGCATQREARALLSRLEAVGDWDTFASWTRAQHQAALDVLATTPMAQERAAILARGREPW